MKNKAGLFAPILLGVLLILAGTSSLLISLMQRVAEEPFLASAILQLLVYFLPLSFYLLARGIRPTSALKFTLVPVKKLPFLLVMSLVLFSGILLFRYLGVFFFDPAFLETPSAVPVPAEGGNRFLLFFCSVLLPALLEEIVFRGVLLEEYRPYGSFWAVFMTSVMYAMLHLSPANFLFDLFVGVILGVMTVLSDSLLPAVGLQALIKFSHLYARAPVIDYLRQAGKSLLLPYLLIGLFLLTIVLWMARLEAYYHSRAYDEMLQSRKELLRLEVEEAQREREEKQKNSSKPRDGFFSAFKSLLLSPSFLIVVALYVLFAWNVFQL